MFAFWYVLSLHITIDNWLPERTARLSIPDLRIGELTKVNQKNQAGIAENRTGFLFDYQCFDRL